MTSPRKKGPLAYLYQQTPLYRVVRRGWKNPLDASFSQKTADRRWNTADFPALYCCSSSKVARAVTIDLFRFAGLQMEDLKPEVRPQLVELAWTGRLVDMATEKGVDAAGFPATYPSGVCRQKTRSAAVRWHTNRWEGVLGRSASLHRLRFSNWSGTPEIWSEIAIFSQRTKTQPRLIRRVSGTGWMRS